MIELKSAQEMKRLAEQVESYASLIEKNQGAGLCSLGARHLSAFRVQPSAGSSGHRQACYPILERKHCVARVFEWLAIHNRRKALRSEWSVRYERLALEGPALPSEVGSISAGPTPSATRLVACHAAWSAGWTRRVRAAAQQLLPKSALAEDPLLNFLCPEVGRYAERRAPIVLAQEGTLDQIASGEVCCLRCRSVSTSLVSFERIPMLRLRYSRL